jgi:hypothetical protein
MKAIDLKAIRQRLDAIPRGELGVNRDEVVILVRVDAPALLELVDATVGALLVLEWSKPGTEGGACAQSASLFERVAMEAMTTRDAASTRP